MRLLLLVLFVSICSYGVAQNPQVQKIPKLNGKELNKAQMDSILQQYNIKVNNGSIVVTPKLKPGIHYLSDGMPCVVPEEPTAGKIPNAFSGIRLNKNAIPNPALPKGKKPEKKENM